MEGFLRLRSRPIQIILGLLGVFFLSFFLLDLDSNSTSLTRFDDEFTSQSNLIGDKNDNQNWRGNGIIRKPGKPVMGRLANATLK